MKIFKNTKKTEETPKLTSEEIKYAYDHPVFSWDAREYVKSQRGKTWFLLSGLILILIVTYSLFTGNWSTALAFLVLAAVVYLQHHEQPRLIKVIVSEIGLKIDKIELPYSNIKYFWIVYNPPFVKTLHIVTINKFMPEIIIQLEEQNPSPLRNYLVQQIPEIAGRDESATQLITRLFKLQ